MYLAMLEDLLADDKHVPARLSSNHDRAHVEPNL